MQERDPVLRDILRIRNMVRDIAEAASITPGAVSQWAQVPPQHVLVVERVTGVSRTRLRPDLYPAEDGQ